MPKKIYSFYLLITALFLYNLFFISSPVIGAGIVFAYFAASGFLCGRVVGRVVPLGGVVLRTIIGGFLFFTLLAYISGGFIILYKFTSGIALFIVLMASIVLVALDKKYALAISYYSGSIKAQIGQKKEAIKRYFFSLDTTSYLVPIVIAGISLLAVGFYTLFSSAAPDAYIRSPWEAIPSSFVWVIFLLSAFIVGVIVLRPRFYFLGVIILFSFLVHLYIPAVYRIPYGLDDWRHIGAMEKIVGEGVVEPYVITPYTKWSTVGTVKVPTALISPKLSYGSFWAAALLLHKSLHINLISLTIWWQYILFSLFVPAFFYLIGKQFTAKGTFPLLLAHLPVLFYPMQLYGSISLPTGYGFLLFLFFLYTVVIWLKEGKRRVAYLLGAEVITLLFGYVVYFLIALLIVAFLWVYASTRKYYTSVFQKLVRIGFLFGSILYIPFVSLMASPHARFDVATTQMGYFRDFWVHVFKYLSGFKSIGSPRPQAGNLIWHDMERRLVAVFPFNWHYFDTVLFILLCLLLAGAIRVLVRKENEKNTHTILIVFLVWISIGSIFIDRYYFGGIHLLTERMDLVVDSSLLLLLASGIWYMLKHLGQKVLQKKGIVKRAHFASKIAVAVFISFVFTSTYTSGPVYGRVTQSQYKTMRQIYEDMVSYDRTRYCVLGEHFPLAALEAVSKGSVLNGNFPIKYGYLEDNGFIFVKMFSDPHLFWMKRAVNLAGTTGCYVVLDKRFLADWNKTQIRWILGREVLKVDDNLVWRYDGEKE